MILRRVISYKFNYLLISALFSDISDKDDIVKMAEDYHKFDMAYFFKNSKWKESNVFKRI